jgi:hypothetical protein
VTYRANLGWRHLELVRSLGAEWRLPGRIANDVASGGVAVIGAVLLAHDGWAPES